MMPETGNPWLSPHLWGFVERGMMAVRGYAGDKASKSPQGSRTLGAFVWVGLGGINR